jgi:transcriptional regulator of arginine metabolism
VVVMKQLRQRAIRDLVEQRPIRTQQELAAALRDRGFRTTQATISRDIAELQLVKAHRDGVSVYALPPRLADADPTGEDRLRRLFRDLPVEIRETGPLLVLVTLPGSAHAIAASLDRARWPDVVGSIAGDDTCFVACADRRALRRVRERLERLAVGPGAAARAGRPALTLREGRDYDPRRPDFGRPSIGGGCQGFVSVSATSSPPAASSTPAVAEDHLGAAPP